jgi:hypothetical protein
VVFYIYISIGAPSRDRSSSALKAASDRLELAETLFPPASNVNTRRNGFQLSTSFRETCKQLPGNKADICLRLDYLRQILIEHYHLIEAKLPESVDPDSSKDDI